MGTCFSTARGILDLVIMTMRIDVPCESLAFPVPAEISNGPEYMQVMHSYEDVEDDCVIIGSPSAWARASRHVHTTNGSTEKQVDAQFQPSNYSRVGAG